jgi:hypothetical protein
LGKFGNLMTEAFLSFAFPFITCYGLCALPEPVEGMENYQQISVPELVEGVEGPVMEKS